MNNCFAKATMLHFSRTKCLEKLRVFFKKASKSSVIYFSSPEKSIKIVHCLNFMQKIKKSLLKCFEKIQISSVSNQISVFIKPVKIIPRIMSYCYLIYILFHSPFFSVALHSRATDLFNTSRNLLLKS